MASGNGTGKRSPLEAAQLARRHVEELVGKEVESVSGVGRDGNGGWKVTVELVELERIPDTTSLLGTYEVRLDDGGELQEARRVRRYARNQADPAQRDGSGGRKEGQDS